MRGQLAGENTVGSGEYSWYVRIQLVGESTVGKGEDSW